MNKLAIFYHVGQFNHWEDVYTEQMERLKKSKLLDAADMLYIGINGDMPLPFIPDKAIVNYNEDKVLEANTLEALWKFCRDNPDYKVLYFHTKGVTRDRDYGERKLFTVTTAWRRYLEYFCIDKWETCVKELDSFDTCGVQIRHQAEYNAENGNSFIIDIDFYDGNFWWANASYINKLDPQYMYINDVPWLRGKSELWIGTGKPNAKSLFNFDYINPYTSGFYEEWIYMDKPKMKKPEFPRIVMIAMFKNEATVIRRMLDSTLGYCDYYVFQDNGSTDGTNEIVQQFLDENKLEGIIYNCQEGWQGFGWNRDHLIRYCQEQVDHKCDWILKMDCDEVLEVDDDFDWSPLYDKSVAGWHITAINGSCMYHRCWLWNADMKWAFNHDPCHETIYHQDPNIGENFERRDLPHKIRQVGFNEGQSWGNPTKFVTDALILEEKLISEGDMLELHKQYHFWYIGKSYLDAHSCRAFPLGETHQREYARRAIWYFAEWIKHVYKNKPLGYDESAYTALVFSADARRFLGEWDEAIATYKQAEVFAPMRNDHLVGLAECYNHLKQYVKMLEVTTQLVNPLRTNPFPRSTSFINKEHYYDTGTYPGILHQMALEHVNAERANPGLPFFINSRQNQSRRMFIVDNFYSNPDEIRNYALTQVEYEQDLRWYKGLRSKTVYRPQGLKESFEHIIGQKIVDFESCYNGVFQIMMSADPQVYHYDMQRWAAMIYLSPNAPIQSGTRLHKSRRNATTHRDHVGADDAFRGDFYDSTLFDITDSAANIYNRLVIMDAGCFHSAGPYFGNTMETGRLTHLFFFD